MFLFPLKKIGSKVSNSKIYFQRSKYIVLLPEVSGDTAENNALLRPASLPAFSEITAEKCVNAIGKLVVEYESQIFNLDQKLYDAEIPKNVQNVILPLDKLAGPLDFAWGAFKVLATVLHNESIANAYARIHPRLIKAKRERFLNGSIYRAFKELDVDKKLYTEPVRRIISKYLLEARLSGMDLSENAYKHFERIITKLNEHCNNYNRNLLYSTEAFTHNLEFDDVKNFPPDVLQLLATDPQNPTNGPWVLKLNPLSYESFMGHCENRMLRWNAWIAYNSRASSTTDTSLNNSISIEEIRFQRGEHAKILDFKNFAELSMKTKMAGSVENVMNMITTLHLKSKIAMLSEINDLQTFANNKGFPQKLELWDIPYWQRLHKEELFQIDDALVRQYFPFPTVLKGLFNLLKKLFAIDIKECKSDVDVWHEDVTFYQVFDENGKEIASFFMDPYMRKEEKINGAWMEVGRNRSDVIDMTPLSYIIFNFHPSQLGQPALLSYDDLKILLKKFGHLLQHSLTTIPYNEVSGLTNLEWDVVNVCPLVMSSFLKNYKTVAELSSHVESGKQISPELHNKLLKRDEYMRGYRLNEELFLSALDIELYATNEHWVNILQRLWTQYLPFPCEKKIAYPCSFSQIFCGQYPASYFSHLWAEMIAADVFSAFQEADLDNDEGIKEIAKRFRDTYLALGGGCHPSEIFRQFRGRDPCIDALISSYGLKI